jgi:hypothetical protein
MTEKEKKTGQSEHKSRFQGVFWPENGEKWRISGNEKGRKVPRARKGTETF